MTTIVSQGKKSCFIISPIGEPDTPERKRNDDVRDYIIKESMSAIGYEAVRADEIDQAGAITSQITQHLFEDDLVIADLTGHNPNVFYELAVRHATRKPFVQIIQKDMSIPFDVQGMRLIFYDLSDPASVHSAKLEIVNQVKSWEGDPPPIVQTPISMPLEILRIRQSDDADTSGIIDILPLIQNISSSMEETREEVQRVSRRAAVSSANRPPIGLTYRSLSSAMGEGSPFAFIAFVTLFKERAPWLYELGKESYRQVLVGNLGQGRELFQYMLDFIGNMEDQAAPRSSGYMEYVEELENLFERMLSYVQSNAYDGNDLPF